MQCSGYERGYKIDDGCTGKENEINASQEVGSRCNGQAASEQVEKMCTRVRRGYLRIPKFTLTAHATNAPTSFRELPSTTIRSR